MRINARLDEDHSQKLEKLRKFNKLSVSDVIKQAIDIMYAQQEVAPKKKLRSLLNSEFIGIASGPEDLATDYKHYLKEELGSKHGAH